MGSRMEALVGELTKKAASKANKAMASKELTKLREAYRLAPTTGLGSSTN